MTKLLFLDDEQYRHDDAIEMYGKNYEVHSVYTAGEAIDALMKQHYEIVSLDHDLKIRYDVPRGYWTGLEVARHIIKHPNCCESVIVHSLNHTAADVMMIDLHRAGIYAIRKPAKEKE